MDKIYVVKVGDYLYLTDYGEFKDRHVTMHSCKLYTLDEAEKLAEEVGGEVCMLCESKGNSYTYPSKDYVIKSGNLYAHSFSGCDVNLSDTYCIIEKGYENACNSAKGIKGKLYEITNCYVELDL